MVNSMKNIFFVLLGLACLFFSVYLPFMETTLNDITGPISTMCLLVFGICFLEHGTSEDNQQVQEALLAERNGVQTEQLPAPPQTVETTTCIVCHQLMRRPAPGHNHLRVCSQACHNKYADGL